MPRERGTVVPSLARGEGQERDVRECVVVLVIVPWVWVSEESERRQGRAQ